MKNTAIKLNEEKVMDIRVARTAKGITYGMGDVGKELKDLLAKRELYVTSGNNTKELDLAIESASVGLLFDPRKTLRMNYLRDKNVVKMSQEEKEEFEFLIEEEIDFKNDSMLKTLPEDIMSLIGSDKTLKVAKILKTVKQNNFNRIQELTWVPTMMKTFALSPLTLTALDIPSSVCKARLTLGESVEIKKPLLKFEFVSVVFDDYTGSLNSHLWTIIFDIEDVVASDFVSDLHEEEIM